MINLSCLFFTNFHYFFPNSDTNIGYFLKNRYKWRGLGWWIWFGRWSSFRTLGQPSGGGWYWWTRSWYLWVGYLQLSIYTREYSHTYEVKFLGSYSPIRNESDSWMAVVGTFLAISCLLYGYLSQNWDSDCHFEVLTKYKS